MYKIYDQATKKYLNGTSGKIKWTTEANARVFKRREDVRNFLRFVVGVESGWVREEDIAEIPNNWSVVGYESRIIVAKDARYVLRDGII